MTLIQATAGEQDQDSGEPVPQGPGGGARGGPPQGPDARRQLQEGGGGCPQTAPGRAEEDGLPDTRDILFSLLKTGSTASPGEGV